MQFYSLESVSYRQGKGTFSISALARLADISPGSLSETLKTGVLLEPSQLAKTLISRGFDGALLEEFSKTGIPDIARLVGRITQFHLTRLL